MIWAERQTKEELENNLATVAAQAGVSDAEMVDYCLFEGVKYIITDSLLTRARACDGHGIEL